jgi:hypothetical protein
MKYDYLANVIAAMKHWCCSSEDADVAKIYFMYFNPATQLSGQGIHNRTSTLIHEGTQGGTSGKGAKS